MKELSFFNSTINDLMKKNKKKTKGIVFNSDLFSLPSKSPINISLEKKKTTSFKISTLAKKMSSNLVNEKKNLRQVLYTLPEKINENSFPFFNRSFDKKRLKMLFSWYYANRGEATTFSLVETLQKLGFSYAMQAGISLGVDDLKVPPSKRESLTEAVELLTNTKTSVNSGNVTALEEFQQFVDTWHRTSENLKTSVVQNFSRSSLNLLKKTNGTSFSNISAKREENIKTSLVDSRSKKNQTIKRSPFEYFNHSEKQHIFSKKIKDIRKQNASVKFTEKPYRQNQRSFASYSTILNPVYMMAFSGARGNLSQVRQLVGMRGLMADPQGQLVEFPIQSNFREGLTVTEYMISCYGARKGLVDTALRTAAAGYLTRRLVDVSHHQIVRFVTCGTKNGILLTNKENKKEENKNTLLPSAWKASPYSKRTVEQRTFNSASNLYNKNDQSPFHLLNNNLKKPSLTNSKVNPPLLLEKKNAKDKKASLVFCVGRVLARDIPGYAFRNQEIDIALASSRALRKVYDTVGIYIRSPLTCKAETGICQLCYGWSISANRLVGLGEAVGIIAAQSIGEPGTQLTMRTFHTGGVFSGDIMEECRAKHAGTVFFQNIYLGLLVRTAGGAIAFCLKTSATFQIKGVNEVTTYNVSANTLLFVRQGEKVITDTLLAQIPNLPTIEENTGEATKTIVSDLSGEVRQKAAVNPELASIRILAGQECKEFYFFDMFAKQNQHSNTLKYLKNHLIWTNSFNKKAQITENSKYLAKDWKTSFEEKEYSLAFQHPKKTKGFVKFFLGAHRLGSNKTFSLNINGSKNEGVLVDQNVTKQDNFLANLSFSKLGSLSEDLTKALNKRKKTIENLDDLTSSDSLQSRSIYNVNSLNFIKVTLLRDLRFLIASKVHQNKFTTPVLFKNNSVQQLGSDFRILAKVELPNKNKKISNKETTVNALFLVDNEKSIKHKFINSNVFHLVIYKAITSTNQSDTLYFLINSRHTDFLKLKNFFLSSRTVKQIPLTSDSNLSTARSLGNSRLYSRSRTLQKNNVIPQLGIKLLDKKILIEKNKTFSQQVLGSFLSKRNNKNTNSALKNLSTLTVWPRNFSPIIFCYTSLFWKLEDLLFFRSRFTKKIKVFSQLRFSTNQQWWGTKKSNVCKKFILTESKGFRIINFFTEPKNTFPIKSFSPILFRLLSRFNIEKYLKTFHPFQLEIEKALPAFSMSSENFESKNSKPRIKYQESGEIFTLQGNTNLKEFQKNYGYCQSVTQLNRGLLLHYNRISYKIPLCDVYATRPLVLAETHNLNLTNDHLSFLRSNLALLNLSDFRASVNLRNSPYLDSAQKHDQNLAEAKRNNENLTNLQSKFKPSFFSEGIITNNKLVPQIGSFINTGDEIIKQCASAYCGQIIEKSPTGLTLRLTQNILYSNLRNRPAKISQNVKNSDWIKKGTPLVTLPYISNVTGDIVAGIPKIEQLFEARGEALDETVEQIWTSKKLSTVPRAKAVRECFKEIGLFVVAAIQKVYSSQGVHIADKHLEVIIRQMTRRALIIDPGDTEFLPDEFVDLTTIECVNWATYGDNALYRPRLIGITKASLTSNSFLSSASFQQTARVLERETVLEKTDRLLGLKERVMMGAIINAGTGELKTSVKLSDRSLARSVSTKLIQRLSFFSRRKIKVKKKNK